MFANKDINPVTTTMFVLEIAKKTLLKNFCGKMNSIENAYP